MTKITSFGKKNLPNDVSCKMSHLPSQHATKEHVLHLFHKRLATMGTTFINYCQDSPTPFIHYTSLWTIDQRKTTSLCTLCSCQITIQLGEVEEGISFHHLLRVVFLRVFWIIIHFQPSLAEYARKNVMSCRHHHAKSKKSWSNLPN